MIFITKQSTNNLIFTCVKISLEFLKHFTLELLITEFSFNKVGNIIKLVMR